MSVYSRFAARRSSRRNRRVLLHIVETGRPPEQSDYAWVNQTYGDISSPKEGEADGEVEVPDRDDPLSPPHVHVIVAFVAEVVQEVGKRFLELESRLFQRQRELEVQLDGRERAQEELEETFDAGGGGTADPAPSVSPVLFWIFTIAIVSLDFPLMLKVFRTLQFAGYEAMLLAVGVQLVLFGSAKICGILLFNFRHRERRDFFTAAVAVAIAGAAIFGCFQLAGLRSAFLEREAQLFEGLAEERGIPIPPDLQEPPPSSGMFTILLILTFSVGAALSWLSHDPRRRRTVRARLAWSRWRARKAREELARVRVRRKRNFEHADADAAEWEQWSCTLQGVYWSANLRSRRREHTTALRTAAKECLPLPRAAWRDGAYDFGELT